MVIIISDWGPITMNAKQSRRCNDGTIIRNYHVTARTAEAVRRLSFETGITEGQVLDKIVRTHLASVELDSLLESGGVFP